MRASARQLGWGVLAAVHLVGCGAGFTVRARAPESMAVRDGARPPLGAAGTDTDTSTGATGEPPQLLGPDVPGSETAVEEEGPRIDGSHAVASRYAALGRAPCEAELAKRNIAFERVGEARGVIAPLRLKGPVGGIEFHSMLPAAQRRTSPYEIYDCRLVLALDDWARVLARHEVVEVVHYSVYRPPPPKATLQGPGRRHTGALAIDAAIFKMKDGRSINVEKDFHGRIGSKPCGTLTTSLPPEAVTLRQLVCEAADEQLFNVMLTPDYNWPHRNHFHLEVTAGVRWVLVR